MKKLLKWIIIIAVILAILFTWLFWPFENRPAIPCIVTDPEEIRTLC